VKKRKGVKRERVFVEKGLAFFRVVHKRGWKLRDSEE
jgi:hypothetical protein